MEMGQPETIAEENPLSFMRQSLHDAVNRDVNYKVQVLMSFNLHHVRFKLRLVLAEL